MITIDGRAGCVAALRRRRTRPAPLGVTCSRPASGRIRQVLTARSRATVAENLEIDGTCRAQIVVPPEGDSPVL
jgi:hypothetical protein